MTVITNLKPIGSVTCIPGLLEFRYLENNGAAFGFFAGLSWLLIILTIGLMAALLVFCSAISTTHGCRARRACSSSRAASVTSLTVLFSAMWSNYIHVLFFPYVFNFADCCVVVGAILFAVWYLFFKDKKEAADKKVNEPTETTADGVGK